MSYNGFKDTLDSINLLKELVEGLEWSGQPAFERVELFDLTDLSRALSELMAFRGRACFIVPEGDEFTHEVHGRELLVRQTRSVDLLFTDRHFGKRQLALIGGESNPGVLRLSDLVRDAVTRLLADGIYIVPENGTPLVINSGDPQQAAGRVGWTMSVLLVGGEFRAPLGNKPIA